MNTERLNHYRAELEKQLAELSLTQQEHEKLLSESHTSTDFVGPDRAAELESFEVDSSVVESEQKLAQKIGHALRRIETGTYGVCEACGIAIPDERLDAKPSVSLCISCQEQHESEQ